jgi:hypothetical protein
MVGSRCWDSVDLERRAVSVVRQLTEDLEGRLVLSDLKTETSRRTLELPDDVMRSLIKRSACKQHPLSGSMLCTSDACRAR